MCSVDTSSLAFGLFTNSQSEEAMKEHTDLDLENNQVPGLSAHNKPAAAACADGEILSNDSGSLSGPIPAFKSSDAREALMAMAKGSGTHFTDHPPQKKPDPRPVAFCRRILFRAFIVAVFVGTAAYLDLDALIVQDQSHFLHSLKLLSLPLVSLLFTWFHVWLAMIMMFYPINFYGVPKRPIIPSWLDLPINGWQGIVPRKAGEIAQRCSDKMIGNICTIEEFAPLRSLHYLGFWDNLQAVFGDVCAEVLQKTLVTRWPSLWSVLAPDVQEELIKKVCEETKRSFLPALVELKANINSILDIRQMAAEALANDPQMMVDIFRLVAARELTFITHVAAVMGFLLGLVQLFFYVAFANTWKYGDYVFLPVSGLIIGYFTNWLALKMTFAPIYQCMMFGNYINVQGVFLKRQKDVAEQMASAICEKVIDARAMLDYMFRNPSTTGGVDLVIDIYRRIFCASLDQQFGSAVSVFAGFGVAPCGIAPEFEKLKQDVLTYSLQILPQHTKEIERYLDEAMRVTDTLSWRLARVSPEEFEDIIHPIFKQDEWILVAVGGFLGVVIGLLQAWALQTINA